MEKPHPPPFYTSSLTSPRRPGICHGLLYRVYSQAEHVASIAADLGAVGAMPFFKDTTLDDWCLATLLSTFHNRLIYGVSSAECESRLLHGLDHRQKKVKLRFTR